MSMDNLLDSIKNTYEHLMDNESRVIYNNRFLYSLTDDLKYIGNIIKTSFPKIDKFGKNKLFLFGYGEWAKLYLKIWPYFNWAGLVDNNKEKWGKCVNGLKVISPENLVKSLGGGDVCVSSFLGQDDIIMQLLNYGIAKKCIINMFDLGAEINQTTDFLNRNQYFDLPQLYHVDNESFVDAGCYDGKTSLEFIKWSKEKYSHIYAFEADPKNLIKVKKNLNKAKIRDKIDIIPKGVWSNNTILKFNSMNNIGSLIQEEGIIDLPVTTLDNKLCDKEITFIKMDIEGSELNALKGAKKIICEQKPKLAISLYHKRKDILDIPDLLLSYNPEYKFYLRHYSLYNCETVLYAI